jgi:hypothetical protein
MNQRERVKLLCGSYHPPALKRSDRAFCLARDCEVTVTSWTDARISWPRCRALGTHGGGRGLLVEDELARAVRCESAAAIMHWWGRDRRRRLALAEGAGHHPDEQRGDTPAGAGVGRTWRGRG